MSAHILRSEIGNTSILHLKIMFYYQLVQMMLIWYSSWVLCQTIQKSVDICLRSCTKTNEGEIFRQSNRILHQRGFFFSFTESLKFFTFNKVVGNFCKCNTSKTISVLYLSDGKEYKELSCKENIKILFMKECFGNFSERNIFPFVICNLGIYNARGEKWEQSEKKSR